ncbi:MAG: hypothetical protein B9S33_18895 [Pedosphaera sp. Tous-C6FEB]|nr:MAG: hypothetical protein B9S33_18895 [Pedosphaera sp. Tous-C6FEB]
MKSRLPLIALLTLFGHVAMLAATKPAADYLPLGEGSEWTMDIEVTYAAGQRIQGIGRRVTGPSEVRDGKTYFRSRTWEEFEGQPRQERTKLMRKDAVGLHSIDLSRKVPREEIEIVLPLKVGARWQTRHLYGKELNHEVVSQESVVIGEKTYPNCFHIRTTSAAGDYTEEFWEAPDIGLVKAEVTMPGVQVTLKLRKFKSANTAVK